MTILMGAIFIEPTASSQELKASGSQLAASSCFSANLMTLKTVPTEVSIGEGADMSREDFWTGFAVGASVGAVAGLAGLRVFQRRNQEVDSHVLRLEKSINIGRPVRAVFSAWSNFERLPLWISFVRRVERFGTHTRWLVIIDGREFEWDAQITQVVENESIGWKSLSGPRQTGRITFSPLNGQTVVHVVMNYAPPLGGFGSLLPIDEHLESWIDRGLREFKSALEREAYQHTGTESATGVPGERQAPGTLRSTRPAKRR